MTHRREVDGLRALAVLAVVLYHAAAPAALHHRQSQIDALGARGVDLFFVLSGFCLSWPYRRAMSVPDSLTFLRRRLTRIAPPFYAALALFAVLAATRFGLPSAGLAHLPGRAQLDDLGRDAAFFMTLNPLHDPPMWTLGIEMRWYVLFPLLLALFFRSKLGFAAVAAASYVAYATVGLFDGATLPTFMLGIVAAALAKRDAKLNAVWPLVAPVALALGVADQQRSLAIDHGSFVWAFACFTLVMAITTNASLRQAFSWPPLAAIGVASYSIYLIHQPVLDSLVWAGASPALAALASVVAGIVFWALVERPFCSKAARSAMEAWLLRTWYALPLVQQRPLLDSAGSKS